MKSLGADENRPEPRESAIQSKIEHLKASLRQIEARQGSLLTKIEKRIDRKQRTSRLLDGETSPYSALQDRRARHQQEEVDRLRRQAEDEILERERMQRVWDDRERDLMEERARRDQEEIELRQSIDYASQQQQQISLDEERKMLEYQSMMKQAELEQEQ